MRTSHFSLSTLLGAEIEKQCLQQLPPRPLGFLSTDPSLSRLSHCADGELVMPGVSSVAEGAASLPEPPNPAKPTRPDLAGVESSLGPRKRVRSRAAVNSRVPETRRQ